MKRMLLGIVMTMLAIVICCGSGAGLILWRIYDLLQAPRAAGNEFMQAMADEQYETAYRMLTPAYQTRLENASGLAAIFIEAPPATWNFSSITSINGTGSVEGTLTDTDGEIYTLTLSLLEINEEWHIDGVTYTFDPAANDRP